MSVYIHQLPNWPSFHWNLESIASLLAEVRHQQGRILGQMENIGFSLQKEASLQTITMDVLKSSEIEGELLDAEQVRSSVARRLGMDIAGLVPSDRQVDGVVEMMLDATQQYTQPLSAERLFGWHAALFPTGRSGMLKIEVASWRTNSKNDPMQVVSGPMGREQVHFTAPDADKLTNEMNRFLHWFNAEQNTDPLIKAAIAHLWFVTIHPLDDGNGRIARAITDLQLARTDNTPHRFYSMSTQIRKERTAYYNLLEQTQKGTLDITEWLLWFLNCFNRALAATTETLTAVFKKAKFWEQYASTQFNNRQQLMINKLLSGFEGKLTSSKWAAITKSSADTALRDLQDLLQKKVIVQEVGGGRSTSYRLL